MNMGIVMAKKKSVDELKLGVARIERDIITKARMIAADRGAPLAGYLSDSLRAVVERDWAKMVKKADEGSLGGK
jgi:hypothetical protein